MRKTAVLGMLLGFVGSSYAGQCSPAQMVKIVVANESPAIPQGNFASLPKTIYRYGPTLARIEEAVDAQNNIHGLIVVSEPDSWIVNLATRQGTHAVDAKEPFVVRLPVFADRAQDKSFPRELLDLEFGCEAAFFDHWKSPEEPLRGDRAGRIRRAFGIGGWLAVLIREKETSAPSVLFLFRGDDIVGAFRYCSYQLVARDTLLFERPRGISFAEPPPN